MKVNKDGAIITYNKLLPKEAGGYHDTVIPKVDHYGNVVGYNIHGTIEAFPEDYLLRKAYSKNVIDADATEYINEIK